MLTRPSSFRSANTEDVGGIGEGLGVGAFGNTVGVEIGGTGVNRKDGLRLRQERERLALPSSFVSRVRSACKYVSRTSPE